MPNYFNMPDYSNMNYSNRLSQDELREKIKQIIAKDSSRLSNTNYSAYPGKTLSPMSSLTQRAQALDEQRSIKGMPYKNSLNKIANSPLEGISQVDMQTMLGDLKNKHNQFGQNVIGGRLAKQFGSAYDPYKNKFESKLNKDIDLRLGDTKGDIENLNGTVKQLESKRNNAVFNALSNSSRGKYARGQGLISTLDEFGQQKHGINNKILTGDKARFEAERNEPYERLHNLQQSLNGIDGEEDHPDLSAQNAQSLKKALVAYGVDVGKPVDSWGHGNSLHTPTYQGKLVEPINAEMNSSYRLAEEIDPKYQDKNYASRKNIRKDLVDSPSSISKFISTLPEQLRPKFELLDAEAKKKAKADMTSLNAKYIKRGMYGGQSHIQSASDRMREINDAAFGARSNVLKNELGQGITSGHTDNINKVHKLSQYDQLANTEFGDMLGDIKRTNTVGLEKWKNDQTGNEQLYKAYQNEKGYQQPRLLGNAKMAGAMSGIDGMFGHFSNQGIDLNSISDLQSKYNNLEKELSTANNKIKTHDDYQKQKQLIASQEKAKQELQKKMDMENAKKLQDAKNKTINNAKTQVPQYDYNALRNELSNIGVIDLKPSQAYYPQQQTRLNELQNLLKGRATYGTRYQNPDPFYSNMVFHRPKFWGEK
jgi:hypothetical protein